MTDTAAPTTTSLPLRRSVERSTGWDLSLTPADAGRHPALASWWGLFLRDALVLRHNLGQTIAQTAVQPVLFLFVFAYVIPEITNGTAAATLPTFLVPGLAAAAGALTGISSVGLPLSVEFGATGEIEDRALAPLPPWALAAEKIVFGTLQSIASALFVLVLAAVVPAMRNAVSFESRPLLAAVLVLVGVTSAARGRVGGCVVKPGRIELMFSVVVAPLSFLGCIYYPWTSLELIPWLQYLVLVNPLVYLTEGLRAALTPTIPTMPMWAFGGAALAYATVAVAAGVALFNRRLTA